MVIASINLVNIPVSGKCAQIVAYESILSLSIAFNYRSAIVKNGYLLEEVLPKISPQNE
jgi:hypothetical protein